MSLDRARQNQKLFLRNLLLSINLDKSITIDNNELFYPHAGTPDFLYRLLYLTKD